MKKILLTILLFAVAITSFAYDFSAVCPSGQTLYYNITSNSTVEVTYPGNLSLNRYPINDYRYYEIIDPYAFYSSYNTFDLYGSSRSYYKKEQSFLRPGGDLIIPNNVIYNDVTYIVTAIRDCAFYECSSLTSVVISDSIRSIGKYSFYGCNAIDSVYLGDNIETIGGASFQKCSSLRIIYYNSKSNKTGLVANNDSYWNWLCPNGGCYNRTRLGPVLKKEDSPHLKDIIIGENVRIIPDNCFKKLDIKNLNIRVDSIGYGSFSECDSLFTISINTKKSCFGYIGDNAFADCDRLVAVTMGDSVRTVGNGAFKGCFRLNNVAMGSGIAALGDSVFQGCVRLVNPKLPRDLTTIGASAFDGCAAINGKLTFPSNMTRIGNNAYKGVGTVTEIEMEGATPPTIYANTFAAVSKSIPVKVPCGTVLNYYTTDYWEDFPNIVEAPPYKVAVESNNTVMGTASVTQQPSCSDPTARLQATAKTGYHFLEWQDGNNANPRTVTLSSDSAFIAMFAVNNIYITVGSNNTAQGTVSGGGLYSYNAQVTLRATAQNGFHFLQWSDGETENPRTFAATRDLNITATFVSNESRITVTTAAPEMGGVDGSGTYNYRSLVTLTATPSYGYHFLQWSDGNTDNPRTITVSQDMRYEAYFSPNIYTIEVVSNSSIMGNVAGGGSYTYRHETAISAEPTYGYHFVQWNDGNVQNPRSIIIERDTAFTAQFAANIYTIAAEADNPQMGSAYGSGTYSYNTPATLTAVATQGYHFVQWSDGVTDNPRTMTVRNNVSLVAQFLVNTYSVDVVSGNPAIGSASGSGTYNHGTPLTITATPMYGYRFSQWSDGNTDNPRLVLVTQNVTYTAQFAAGSFLFTVGVDDPTHGEAIGTGGYAYLSQAMLTATPYYGYHFEQWSDGNTDNPRMLIVRGNTSLTAQFVVNTYSVDVVSDNSAIGDASGSGTYCHGTALTITANPKRGYHFSQWSDGNTDNPRLVSVVQNATYTAQFAIDYYAIGAVADNGTRGEVTGGGTYAYNSAATLSVTPYYGYHFAQWNDGNTDNPRTIMVSQEARFTAQIVPNSYLLQLRSNDATKGTDTGGGTYDYLQTISATAVAAEHYHFVMWSDSVPENPRTLTLTRDTVLTALFAVDSHSISLAANDAARGTLNGAGRYAWNDYTYIEATAAYGYHFERWSDGVQQARRRIHVTQDTIVTAVFGVNRYMLRVESEDTLKGDVAGGGDFDYLERADLTATPRTGYHFVTWSDSVADNPRRVQVVKDSVLCAIFAINRHMLTVSVNDTLMGNAAGSGEYDYLSQATISATAAEHHHFVQWSDGNTSNPRLVTIRGDIEYTAIFEEDERFVLTVVAEDAMKGSVEGGGVYYGGEQAVLRATAEEHYHFDSWNDGVRDNPRALTVLGTVTYTALFAPDIYTLTLGVNNGARGEAIGGGEFAYGSTVQVLARPFAGYRFESWSDGDTHAVRTIVIDGDMSLTALFGVVENEPTEGIAHPDNAAVLNYTIYQQGRCLQVVDATSRKIAVYDVIGRRIAFVSQAQPTETIHLPVAGIYLLQVDGTKAQKVVVAK